MSRSKADFIIRRFEELGPKLSPRVKEVLRRVIEEAERSLSVSTEVDTRGVDPEVISTVVRRPGLIKLLKLLSQRSMYTRELLAHLKMWDRGQELIREAVGLGLIVRESGLCPDKVRRCVWNYITDLGLKVLEVIEKESD